MVEVENKQGGKKTITDLSTVVFEEFIINTVGLIIYSDLISSIRYELLSSKEAQRWEYMYLKNLTIKAKYKVKNNDFASWWLSDIANKEQTRVFFRNVNSFLITICI